MAAGDPSGWPGLFSLVLAVAICFVSANIFVDEERNRLIVGEKYMRFGSLVVLTKQEKKANRNLMAIKKAEIKEAMETHQFPPSMHFFQAKRLIEDSEVFRILRKMPKGKAQRGVVWCAGKRQDTNIGVRDVLGAVVLNRAERTPAAAVPFSVN
jgi:adenosine deaminase CECR1